MGGQIEGVNELVEEVLTEFVARIEARVPTPSLHDTPCLYVLVRLEWVGSAEGVEGEGVRGDAEEVLTEKALMVCSFQRVKMRGLVVYCERSTHEMQRWV